MHRWDPVCPRPRGLVPPVAVDPTGTRGPTKRQASGRRWRRTSQGLYVPATTPVSPEQRILEQAARLPAGGVVTGWAACRLHRASFFDGLATDGFTTLPVPLAVGRHPGFRDEACVCSRDRVDEREVEIIHGVRVFAPTRATIDAMRFAADTREALVVLEMMMAAVLTSPLRVRELLARGPRQLRGRRQVEAALLLARPHARSPTEVRLRLIWELDMGRARPWINPSVHDSARRLIGIADLLDPGAGLVIEYDGAEHRGASRHAADELKSERLRDSGLEVTRVTGPDLRDRGLVVRRLDAAERRARESTLPRTWSAEPRIDVLDEVLDRHDPERRR